MRHRSTLLIATVLAILSSPIRAEDRKAQDFGEDYATGGKLNNQNRLSDPYDNFNRESTQKQSVKNTEAYTLAIRKEMEEAAQKRKAEQQQALNFSGNTPGSALNVAYLEKGHLRITLRAKYLFDENTAIFKPGSMDVIERLAGLLNPKPGERVEFVMVDELDESPALRAVDAERAHLVFSLISFRKISLNSIS